MIGFHLAAIALVVAACGANPLPLSFELSAISGRGSEEVSEVDIEHSGGRISLRSSGDRSALSFVHQHWPDDRVEAFYTLLSESSSSEGLAVVYLCLRGPELVSIWHEEEGTIIKTENATGKGSFVAGKSSLAEFDSSKFIRPPFAKPRTTDGITVSGSSLNVSSDGRGRLQLGEVSYSLVVFHSLDCTMCLPPELDSPDLYPTPLWPETGGWYEFHSILTSESSWCFGFINLYAASRSKVLIRDTVCPGDSRWLVSKSIWLDAVWAKK